MDDRREEFRDFRAFLWFCLGFLGFQPTDTQVDISNELQNAQGNLVIQAQRGVGKSWVLSIYVLWRLYWDPTINVLIVSATEAKALEHSQMILRLMAECEEFQWMHPSNRVPPPGAVDFELRNSKQKFDVADAPISQAPSVRAAGITGQITGSRASLIVADDIETHDNAYTLDMRNKLREQVKEFDHIAKPEGCLIVFLGTPQCEDTLYATLPDRGYRTLIWPAQYPTQATIAHYGDKLAPSLRKLLEKNPKLGEPVALGPFEPDGGKATDRRFPEDVLLKKRLASGANAYRMQYLLNPAAANAEKFPLRLRDLIVFDAPTDMAPPVVIHTHDQTRRAVHLPMPGFRDDALFGEYKTQGDFVPYEDSILYVDPSGRGADETGYVVLKRLNGYLFLLKQGGFRDGYGPDTLRGLVKLARDYAVKRIVTEDNFGDGMFRALLTPVLRDSGYRCGLDSHKVGNRLHKTKRIVEALEPVVSSHKLVVHSRCFLDDMEVPAGLSNEQAVQYRLWWQYSRCTREKDCLPHDDRLDALASAVEVFQAGLSVSSDANAALVSKRAKDAEIKRMCREEGVQYFERGFLSGILGMTAPPTALPRDHKSRSGRHLSYSPPL